MAWKGKIWPILLGILLIVYGVTRFGWVSIDGDFVAIFEIITGAFVLINK